MIEFIVWSIRLWLVDYIVRVRDRQRGLLFSSYSGLPDKVLWRWRWLRDLVDRLSPFDPHVGYRRATIRRFAWILVHPILSSKRASLRIVMPVLSRITPYVGPGRYEGCFPPSDQLKVAWLDMHSEYADKTAGDTQEFGLHVMLFDNLDVPWSREPESWILATDDHGFVSGYQPQDPEATFNSYVGSFLSGEDDIEDEEWTNREGQPEFNGAFR